MEALINFWLVIKTLVLWGIYFASLASVLFYFCAFWGAFCNLFYISPDYPRPDDDECIFTMIISAIIFFVGLLFLVFALTYHWIPGINKEIIDVKRI